MASEGGRQRSRVGGVAGAPEKSLPQTLTSQPYQSMAPKPPAYKPVYNPNPLPAALMQAAANYTASPAGFSQNAEPVVSNKTPAPPAAAYGCAPEPPAPRAWTPSKLAAGKTPRMSPAEALEREMAELEASDPNSTAAPHYSSSSKGSSRPDSGSRGNSRPTSSPLAGMTATPVTPASNGWYKQGYCNSAYAEAAGQALASGRVGSPAPTAQPFVAQHNNLMGGPGGSNSSSNGTAGRGSPGVMANLKERIVGYSSAPGGGVTTVEAFTEAEQSAVVAKSSSSLSALQGPVSNNAIVAQRAAHKPRLLATGHTSNASRTASEWRNEFLAALSSGQKLAAMHLPGPSNGVVQCYVKRSNGVLGMKDAFELRLEASDDLLAVARRRKKSATSSYLISMNADASSITREDELLVGKLKANMMGTEYMLHGKGGEPALHKGYNAQLLAVNYKPTINHVKAGPRTMTAIVPVPESTVWNGSSASSGAQYDSLLTCMDAARARELPLPLERDLVMLHTMKPHFDPIKQVHYLDFKGRVTKMSLKNFQLVHWDHNSNQLGNDLVMQFGKKGHDEYALDFCYPMSLLQAFALALSSIDSKLCYTV